jgi:hypothetical protein
VSDTRRRACNSRPGIVAYPHAIAAQGWLIYLVLAAQHRCCPGSMADTRSFERQRFEATLKRSALPRHMRVRHEPKLISDSWPLTQSRACYGLDSGMGLVSVALSDGGKLFSFANPADSIRDC